MNLSCALKVSKVINKPKYAISQSKQSPKLRFKNN